MFSRNEDLIYRIFDSLDTIEVRTTDDVHNILYAREKEVFGIFSHIFTPHHYEVSIRLERLAENGYLRREEIGCDEYGSFFGYVKTGRTLVRPSSEVSISAQFQFAH